MDLGKLDTVAACDAGAEIELLHPVSKDPIGVFVSIRGKDSNAFKMHIRQSINAKLNQQRANRNRRAPQLTLESSEDEALDALVVCVTGWRTVEGGESFPHIKFNGEELTFNAVNAKRLMAALPWMKQQLDEEIGDLENFLKS